MRVIKARALPLARFVRGGRFGLWGCPRFSFFSFLSASVRRHGQHPHQPRRPRTADRREQVGHRSHAALAGRLLQLLVRYHPTGEARKHLPPANRKSYAFPRLHAPVFQGYYRRTAEYFPTRQRHRLGCFPVPMVHSTMLLDLRKEGMKNLAFFPPHRDYSWPYDDIIVFAFSCRSEGFAADVFKGFGTRQNTDSSVCRSLRGPDVPVQQGALRLPERTG